MNATAGGPSPAGTSSGKPPADPRARVRVAVAVVVTALVTLFAVVNLDQVSVNWIVGTWDTPLIVVIVLSAVLGALADRVVQLRSSPRRR